MLPEVAPGSQPRLLSWRVVGMMLLLSDLVMTLGALYAAHRVRYLEEVHTPFVHTLAVLPVWFLLPIGAVWMLLFRVMGLYDPENLVSGIGEYRRVATAGAITTLGLVVMAYLSVGPPIARGLIVVALLAVTTAVSAGRFGIRRFIYSQARRGRPLNRVVVVGTSRAAVSIARRITDHVSASSEVVGFLTEYLPVGTEVLAGRTVLGEPLDLPAVSARLGVTRALVVESGLSWESLQGLHRLMQGAEGVPIALVPGVFDLHATSMRPVQIGPVLALSSEPAHIVGLAAFAKRVEDVILGTAGFVVGLPFALALLALAGFRRRPLLQSERYVGSAGEYKLWRFAGSGWADRWHVARLPYLLAVVTGRLSLMGPRPVRAGDAERRSAAFEALQLAKPGFLGPWWLGGADEPEDLIDELRYGLHYLRNYSIWLDLLILVRVFRAVIGGVKRPYIVGSERPSNIDAPILSR